ncbi:ribosomal protein S12 methylthiotransferase accessory factor [Nonomuraea thailandensis]|uniref:Ribosomal protein S12 methylthiotransferase accessory factor n=1 Tax=Nonomuraea thailandensis TaxID=1188745 RepID=A0A9X2K4Z2_9ACTN|nr:YcaO-like family protein [Nonomuraea thailandensis]MCP2360952.1 ribosomal protein S12 methylthiotransferase accessory factor [Nonomuraea thailandensis]
MPLTEAGRRSTAALAALGLRAELVDVGGGRDPAAWWCGLSRADLAPVACGMGKGGREEARLGALFEAIEHHLTGPAGFDPAAVEPAAPAAIAAGPLRADACAPLLAPMPGRRMACRRYRALAGGDDVLVPLFLSSPWYLEAGAAPLRERARDDSDYAHLMRYSCNSGSAVGVTAAEALLHALNEAIERDALSLLLVRAFLCGRRFRPRLIDPGTLPPDAARAYSVAAELTGSPVHLLDITSDLGVATMLAYTPPTSLRPHRRGTGTSLSPAHAAWRALTELVQTTLGEELGGGARGDPAALAAHPVLAACGRFELTGVLRRARVMPLPAAEPDVGTPLAQLRTVSSALVARGLRAYARTVRALPGGVVAVHVMVPGLERFMLVTDGNLVVPGPRGRAAAKERAMAFHPCGEVSGDLPHDWPLGE